MVPEMKTFETPHAGSYWMWSKKEIHILRTARDTTSQAFEALKLISSGRLPNAWNLQSRNNFDWAELACRVSEKKTHLMIRKAIKGNSLSLSHMLAGITIFSDLYDTKRPNAVRHTIYYFSYNRGLNWETSLSKRMYAARRAGSPVVKAGYDTATSSSGVMSVCSRAPKFFTITFPCSHSVVPRRIKRLAFSVSHCLNTLWGAYITIWDLTHRVEEIVPWVD